jgi:hypothetical protein
VPLRNPIWLQFVAHKLLRMLTPDWVMAIGGRNVAVVYKVLF